MEEIDTSDTPQVEQQTLSHTMRTGDIVSIQFQNDPYLSVGRVVEIVNSDDLDLYTYNLLVNPGTEYLPYWVHVDVQTRVTVLNIGEAYQLSAGTYKGKLARFTQLLTKVPLALVTLEDGSEHYVPASILEIRADA